MMRKFTGSVSTGYVGSRRKFEFEVDDDATDEQINETALEVMFDHIDWGYEEKPTESEAAT